MTSARLPVPSNPSALSAWANDFEARFGIPPIAGGETTTVAPPSPAAAPATPTAQPAGTPAAPAAPAEPAAPATPPAAAAPAGEPAAPDRPPWADDLFSRMDQLAPPQQVDPLAVDLGLVDAPLPPFGQDPSQAAPMAPQAQPGFPPSGQAQPGPADGLPGQPLPGQPGENELIQRYIDERAATAAQRIIEERVNPILQGQAADRRRSEGAALTKDYPELKDPARANAVVQGARQWSQAIFGTPDAAGEPGFVEMYLLASKAMESAEGAAPAVPGQPEVPIETPGAASPGAPTTPENELVQRIKSAGPGGNLPSILV